MKVIGWLMVIISGLIVVYNVATSIENENIRANNNKIANADPLGTAISGGSNLQPAKPCYTFKPPYTGFEITVLVAGAVGLFIVMFVRKADRQ